MWPFCYANNPLWLLLPFIIGLLAGWWAWGRRPAVDTGVQTFTPAPVAAPPPPMAPEPVAAAVAPVMAALTAIGIPAAIGDPDNLMDVKGIGPALNKLLISLEVTRFDQIAAWTTEHVGIVDGHLGSFKGRIERDSWVDQAKLLAAGAVEEFERRFGTIGSEHKK
jgi:predicted flap endonuclease-1-like 5' DNA nuclease